MATDVRPTPAGPVAPAQKGLGLFDLLLMAWTDFLHIIQQLKFGIFLLLIIAVLTLIGASVPQAAFGDLPADYLGWYTPEQYRWIVLLGFDRIFHTGYFLALLALLVVSVTLCAFGRLTAARRLASNKKPHTSISELEGTRFNGYLEVPTTDVDTLMAEFKKRQYTTFTREGKHGETQLLARRGLTAKWANVSMHFAFIVLAVGSLIGVTTQLKTTSAVIGEGEVYIQPDTGQRIRLVEYFQEYDPKDFPTPESLYENPFPTDFKSHLQVLAEDGSVLKEKIIEVNHPLIENYVTYYQQSFVQLPEFRVTGDGVDTVISPRPDELTPYPFLKMPILYKPQGSVVGGYWLNEDGSRGERMPFRVRLFEGRPIEGDALGRFRPFPHSEISEGSGVLVEGQPQVVSGPNGELMSIALKGVREATVLQVKRDRGLEITYFAFGVIVVGILYPLFWPYHDGRFVFQPTDAGTTRIWWGSRYRAGRRAFNMLALVWQGKRPRDDEDDLVGDFA